MTFPSILRFSVSASTPRHSEKRGRGREKEKKKERKEEEVSAVSVDPAVEHCYVQSIEEVCLKTRCANLRPEPLCRHGANTIRKFSKHLQVALVFSSTRHHLVRKFLSSEYTAAGEELNIGNK